MNCPVCNAPLSEGSRFCEYCGSPVTAQAPAAAPQPETQPIPAPEPVPEAQAYAAPAPEPIPETQAFAASAEETPAASYAAAQPQWAPQPTAQPQWAPQQVDPNAQPQWAPQPTAQPLGEQPKKKGKRALLIGGIAVLIAAIIGVALFFILRGRIEGAKTAVSKAIASTEADLNAVLDRGQFAAVRKKLEALGDQSSMALNLDARQKTEYYDSTMRADGEVNISGNAEALADGSLTITSTMDAYGNSYSSDPSDLRFAMNAEKLQFSLGDGKVYRTTLGDLTGAAADPAQPAESTASKLTPAALRDSFDGTDGGKFEIETDGGKKTAQRYDVHWTQPDGSVGALDSENLLCSLLLMRGKKFENRGEIYLCDGKLRGFDLHEKESGNTVYVRLMGAANVFDHVRITGTGMVGAADLYCYEDGSLALCSTQNGETVQLFTFHGETGYFKLYIENLSQSAPTETDTETGGPAVRTLDGTLSATDTGALLTLRASVGPEGNGVDYEARIEFKPAVKAPQMLSGTDIDVRSLSEEEQGMLLWTFLGSMTPGMTSGSPAGPVQPDEPDEPEPTDKPDEPEPTDIPDVTFGPGGPGEDLTTPSLAELPGHYEMTAGEYMGMRLDLAMLGVEERLAVELHTGGSGLLFHNTDSAEISWALDGAELVLLSEDEEVMRLVWKDGELWYTIEEMQDVWMIFTKTAD